MNIYWSSLNIHWIYCIFIEFKAKISQEPHATYIYERNQRFKPNPANIDVLNYVSIYYCHRYNIASAVFEVIYIYTWVNKMHKYTCCLHFYLLSIYKQKQPLKCQQRDKHGVFNKLVRTNWSRPLPRTWVVCCWCCKKKLQAKFLVPPLLQIFPASAVNTKTQQFSTKSISKVTPNYEHTC